MKALIKIQFRSILTTYNIIFGLLISFVLGILQAFRLNHELIIINEQGTIADFLLFSLGGWQEPMTLLSTIQWLMLILIVLLISQWTYIISSSWMVMVITRFKTRIFWWFSNCVAQLLICTVILAVLIIGHLIAGYIFFNWDLKWGIYTLNQQILIGDIKPVQLFFIGFFILLTGMYSLILIQMIVKTIFHAGKASMILFIILIILGFSYIYQQITYLLSPIFYPSIIVSVQNGVENALFINIGLCILLSIIGLFVIRIRSIL
ncbi:hypothetical protein [Oceanobacillus locisalsi]|uniref:ABC transporter permease n=1 Tax=Oceanobacillus locisalsi TaxID=546107 RepID=A0ABW3NP42_9BACI